MNKIDAFFVGFSLLLTLFLGLYLIPNPILAFIYQLVAGFAIGWWIGNFVDYLMYGSDTKLLKESYEQQREMLEHLQILIQIVHARQAKIDALMLEYCPDEMTPEQLSNWASNQDAIDPAMQQKINASLH